MIPNQSSFLEQELTSEIDERRDLMLRLKVLLKRLKLEQDKQLFLSYSIPIIYSVWEGFVKIAFEIYIKELNKLNLSIDNICDSIFVYHMESRFSQLRNYPQDFKSKVKLFNNLQKIYVNNTLSIHPVVNTESNVNFNVLNRLLGEFNLEKIDDYIQPRYSLADELDGFLLKIRNAISHGDKSIVVSEEELIRSISLVEKLMDLVFERIRNGFITESYRKHQS
ncbi:MAG: MAE_28990/MAE_18760 family HEPN-like nuclease [Pseudanabaena sp.]|jgi:hypothetical protein